MPVPKSAVKGLSSSHSGSSTVLNIHPHPHIIHHHHHHHHHNHPHHLKSKYHYNKLKQPDDISHSPIGVSNNTIISSSSSGSSSSSSSDIDKEVSPSVMTHTTMTVLDNDLQDDKMGNFQDTLADTHNNGKDTNINLPPNEHTIINNKNPTSWDLQDDLLLRHLKEVRKFGWKEISKYFINRTPNACQFRWRRLKSGNLKNNATATMDIVNINTTEILKAMGVDKILPDLNTSKNNDENILLPQVEITDSTSFPTNKKQINSKDDKHNNNNNSINDQSNLLLSPTSMSNHFNNGQSPRTQSYMEPDSIHHNNIKNNYLKLSASTTMLTKTTPSKLTTHRSSSNKDTKSVSMRKSISSVSMTSFPKPRSFSLNVTRPKLNPQQNGNGSISSDVLQPDDENIGFIPKIIVRSRRSSFNNFVHVTNNGNPLIPTTIPSVTTTSTTTTTTTKLMLPLNDPTINLIARSRKNSFILSQESSRRSSININLNSNNTSRRSSVTLTNEFLDTHQQYSQYMNNLNNSNNNNNNSNTINLTTNNIPPINNNNNNNIHGFTKWNDDEDKLLLNLINEKNLNWKEISILLPNRSEEDIKWRFEYLSKDKINAIPSSNKIDL